MLKILKILWFFSYVIPDFIQSFFYNFFYYLFSKWKFRKKIEIFSKKNPNVKKNLVIMDNLRALGDFFVSLNVIKNLNCQKSDYKYVVVVNKIYENFIKKQNFKNITFIFLLSDFGTFYERKKITSSDVCKISNNISNQIEKYDKNWNKVFICAGSLDLVHYSILSKINYDSAYYLKRFWTKSKPKIIWQNIPVPSISLWLYFFHFYKKFNLKIWNLKNKDIYYYGKMSYDMIKEYDNSLSQYNIDCKKEFVNKENLKNISVMLKTSNKYKSINPQKFINFLTSLNLNKNTNVYFLGKDHYTIPTTKDLNIINLTGETPDLMNLFEYVKNSQLVITADTSLYHIASYFDVPAIVFVNSKSLKVDRHISFWLENYKNNVIIKNNLFFNHSFANNKKKFNSILVTVKKFITENWN